MNEIDNKTEDEIKGSKLKDKSNESNLEAKVEQYEDIEGISTKKLNFGLWYVEHRRQLRLFLIVFLIIIAAVSWTYTIYGFAYYITRGMTEDELLIRAVIQTNAIGHDYIQQISAQDLKYYPVKILRSTDGKYDLIAEIQNPNQKWWAEFDYYFLVGGKEYGHDTGFILPGEVKYLMALAQEFRGKPTVAKLVIKDISWSRINQHKITNWPDFRDSHLNIVVEDIKFTPASQSNLSEKVSLNQLQFSAINKTAYNYWDVGFIILLYSGPNIVNVNKYSISDFMSGEKRQIQASWSGKIGRVDSVEVIPEINIMDDDIYIKYEGGIGEEK